MASDIAINPMNVLKIGLAAAVAFKVFQVVGDITGIKAINRNVPS